MTNFYTQYRHYQEPPKKYPIYSWRKIIGVIFLFIFIISAAFLFSRIERNKNPQTTSKEVKIKIDQGISEIYKLKIEKYFAENKDLGNIKYVDSEPFDIILTKTTNQTLNNKKIIAESPKDGSKFILNQTTLQREFIPQYLYWNDDKFAKLAQSLEDDYKNSQAILVAAGDIMLSRTVGKKIADSKNVYLPFEKIKDLISASDLAFANLESPFLDSGKPIYSGMTFKAEPNTIGGLTFAGFDLLDLANNHFGNQGQAGMLFSFDHLKEAGISYVGAGLNEKEARTAVTKENKGIKFGFLAYDGVNSTPQSYYASTDKPGIAHADPAKIKDDITAAKEKADVVIVQLHAGTEYKVKPTTFQKDFAKAALDSGADLVVGHHSHVVQGIDQIEGKLAFYSLGNFVFDQTFAVETQQGLVVKFIFSSKNLKSAELIPIHIINSYQPNIADSNETQTIITRILSASEL